MKISILRHHILTNDGEIPASLAMEEGGDPSRIQRRFLVIPYTHPYSEIPSTEGITPPPEVVTDLWAERCLQAKRFYEPDEHVLSRPIQVVPIPGFQKLVINSTGLANIDLLHVSKVVNLLGGMYDQTLKIGISVLVCNPEKAGEDKLRHAFEWRIPTVSIDWLWACIRSGRMQPFRSFLLEQGARSNKVPASKGLAGQPVTENPTRRRSPLNNAKTAPGDPSAEDNRGKRGTNASKESMVPGEGFMKSLPKNQDDDGVNGNRKHDKLEVQASTDMKQQNGQNMYGDDEIGLPLQDLSTNSSQKPERAPSPQKARLSRNFDGQSSLTYGEQDEDTPPSAPDATSTGKTTYIPPQPESINGAIKELLGRSKAKRTTNNTTNGNSQKKRLLGRALSNMSNSSREGTNVRVSRASSVDSMNTDGLGSVILDDTSQNGRPSSVGPTGRNGFKGRASAEERKGNALSFELGDASIYGEEYPEEEAPPQMTQLGYENPDDAVALREMLAERRRARTRQGQEDIKPPDAKEEKRIKDDATVSGAGGTIGRRTRPKAKGAL
jgi:DNA replication regulator DPB11